MNTTSCFSLTNVVHSPRIEEKELIMSTVTIRIDDTTKRDVSNISKELGLDISAVTRAFYKQIQRENRIPLNLGFDIPNDETLEAMREAEEILESGQHRFKNSEEVFESLGI